MSLSTATIRRPRRPTLVSARRCKIDRLAHLADAALNTTHNSTLLSSVAESGMPRAENGASPAAEAGGEADVESGLQLPQTAGVAATLDASNPLYGHLDLLAGGPLHKTHTWPPSSTSTVHGEQREPLIRSPGPNPGGDDIERGIRPQQQVGGPAQDDGSVEQGPFSGQPERAEPLSGQPVRPEQALVAGRCDRCPYWCLPRCGGVERRALNRQVIINQPGEWDFMISYTHKSEVSKAIAERLRAELLERGKSVWLDVHMAHRHRSAMREGVEHSQRIIAIVSGDQDSGDDAYFKRPFCLEELRWAKAADKPILPVVDLEDRPRISDLQQIIPPQLADLTESDWVHLDRSAPEHFDVGVTKLIGDGGCRAKGCEARFALTLVLVLVAVVVLAALILVPPQPPQPLPIGQRACGVDSKVDAMPRVSFVCDHIAPVDDDDGQSTRPNGTLCTISCKEGYRAGMLDGMNVQETRTCVDGSWSGPLPICAPEPCTSIVAPANADPELDKKCLGHTGDVCDLTCAEGYQSSGSTSLICGADNIFRGAGTCEPTHACAVNNGLGRCFEETGDPARLCVNTPEGVDDHACIACKRGFTRGMGFHDDDLCEPRCTAPVTTTSFAALRPAADITSSPIGESADSSSVDESSLLALGTGASRNESSSIAAVETGARQGRECDFPFVMWGRSFFDCANERDMPNGQERPAGLPAGSSWCLTDKHDPNSVKQCIDCTGPGGLQCPPLPAPAHGKFVCSEDAPAYKSSCELKCDAGYAHGGSGAKLECGWDEVWYRPSLFGVQPELMGFDAANDSSPTPKLGCWEVVADDGLVQQAMDRQ